jgi:hypothetical protein
MRRLAVMLSALVVVAGGLSVALVAGASGRTRAAAQTQTVAKAPRLVMVPQLAKSPPLVKWRPQLKLAAPAQFGPAPRLRAVPPVKSLTVPPYGACYVGLQQCSIHPCTVYVAPRTAAVASSAVDQIVAQAPVPGPPRSSRCVSTPVQKTEPVGNAVITAVPAKPVGNAVVTAVPAKPVPVLGAPVAARPVLRQSYAQPAAGH